MSSAADLSEREKRVLLATATTISKRGYSRGYVTVGEIAEEVGLSKQATRTTLRNLYVNHQAVIDVKRGSWAIYKGGNGSLILQELRATE